MVKGKVKLVCQEERFLQFKSPWCFPKLSLEYINLYIKKNNLKIDKIAFSTEFNRPFEYRDVPYTQHPNNQGFGLYKHKVDQRVLAA